MTIPLYQVDAFAEALFEGNPAAVCSLPEWLPEDVLRAVAAENKLSETAFIVSGLDPVPLRWFTPTEEVPLCGHATLAAAFVVLEILYPSRRSVTFRSRSGALKVSQHGDRFSLDFPALPPEPVEDEEVPPELPKGLHAEPEEVWITHQDPNYLVILDGESTVAALEPDLGLLEQLHPYGVAVSAPGRSPDFVSRYFAPGYGIPEDSVTGSIHCSLGPYWADRLERTSLEAMQISARRGRVGVKVRGDRVDLSGRAVCYLNGEILL